MVFVAVAHEPVAQPSLAHVFRTVARWLAERRVARRRRVALESLLIMPEHRLRDLGLGHDELLRMLERRR